MKKKSKKEIMNSLKENKLYCEIENQSIAELAKMKEILKSVQEERASYSKALISYTTGITILTMLVKHNVSFSEELANALHKALQDLGNFAGLINHE